MSLVGRLMCSRQCLLRRGANLKNIGKRHMGDANLQIQYRGTIPNNSSTIWNLATAVTFTMTFWIGTMMYKHFGHVTGDFPDIHPEKWTDEELGIPPDEEDIYPPGYIPIAQRS